MNIFRKAYCRIFQRAFRIALPFLPYREPKILEHTSDIAAELKKLGKEKVLLVTDKFLREAGITNSLEKMLEDFKIQFTVYDKTKSNPTVQNVEEAVEMFKAKSCNAIIALGGGSAMDCAKAVGARIVYPEKSVNQLSGILKVRRKIPTLFAIPTTAGTGSEVTLTAVITDSETKHKYTINSFPLIPHYAVSDPEMTFTLPPSLTATTGMDAMTHAIEAYIGKSTSKETRKLSIEAIKLIFENIIAAYEQPENISARKNMLIAAYKAGIAFSKSYVGYVHAIAHTLGGQYNIPHGLANSVLLPVVLREYGNCIHKKLRQLAVKSGIANASDSEKEASEKFIDAIEKLNKKLSIPNSISGIEKDDIAHMSVYADKEANPLYPVPKLMDAKELEKFYHLVADWR